METDTIQIPRKIVEEIYDTHEKIDQIKERSISVVFKGGKRR